MLEARKTQPVRRIAEAASHRRQPQAATQAIDEAIRFDGRAGAIITLILRNMFLTILTFGLYTIWARTGLRRHFLNHSLFLGSRFEFDGDGTTLSAIYAACLLALAGLTAACVLTWQNLVLFAALPVPPALTGAAIIALCIVSALCVFHFASYVASRYALSRTVWRGFSLRQTGSFGEYLGLALPFSLLVVATLGFAYPFMRNRLQGYKINHMRLGRERMHYAGNPEPLLHCWLLPWTVGVALTVAIVLAVEGQARAIGSAQWVRDANLPFHAWNLFMGEKAWMVVSGFVLLALVMYWYRAAEALHFASNLSLGRLQIFSRLTHADILIALLNSVVLVTIMGSVSIAAFVGAGTAMVTFMSGMPSIGHALAILIFLSLSVIAILLGSVRWFVLHNMLAGASHSGLTIRGRITLNRLVVTQPSPAPRNEAAPDGTRAGLRRTDQNG